MVLALLAIAAAAQVLNRNRTSAQVIVESSPVKGSISADVTLHLQAFANGLNQPVGIASAGDYRLFVLEREGRIRVVQPDGTVTATPFLDISNQVDSSSTEEGLLGLVFHPRYDENGLFYVNYTHTSGDVRRTRISSFKVSADPNIAIPTSENILLTVDQPGSNHNAGKLLFGPDGYLYVPLGDGGGSGDNLGNNAQNPARLLGKINRIDVDNGPGSPADCKGQGSGDYTVPSDNPFVNVGGTCDEIWASGLRNPWQSSFDSLTGDLYVADVGQNSYEEVDFQRSDSAGGENYGWRCFEGVHAFNLAGCQDSGAYIFPIFEYPHQGAESGCSVTGGFVYRGRSYGALYGRYFLTDFCTGRFWDLARLSAENWQATVHNDVYVPGESTLRPGNAAFGQRCDGELFLANMELGQVYRLTGSTSADAGLDPPGIGQLIVTDHWLYLPMITLTSCR